MTNRFHALLATAAAGAAFVILDVILGVTLWVSLLVAGCILAAAGIGGLAAVSPGASVRPRPVLDTRVLRARFAAIVALATAAGFLVVASFAFAASTVAVLGWTVGAGIVAVSLALSPTLRRGQHVAAWDALAGLCTALGAWQVVQALVLAPQTARWLTFANGCGLVALALAALTLHELSTERVVHALELVDRRRADDREPALSH
jgi:hypothetical protein